MKSGDLSAVFHSDPETLGGTPVFTGTRVPVQNLVDYLEGGESIDEFLAGFPPVKREQVIQALESNHRQCLLPSGHHRALGDGHAQNDRWVPGVRLSSA